MLMIPTSVADVSCQAVSPWFSQLGLSVRADSIAVPHLCWGLGRTAPGRSAHELCQRQAPGSSAAVHSSQAKRLYAAPSPVRAAPRPETPTSDCCGEPRCHHGARLREVERLRGNRAAGEVALSPVTAQESKQLQRGAGLDALRDHRESQRMAQLDGGPNQLDVLLPAVRDQPVDEGAIQLELGDGEAAEVRKRGEPRSEIVDRDSEAETAQLRDDLPAAFEVANDGGLGDLQDEIRCGHLVAAESAADQLDESGVEQVGGRDVDRDREPVSAGPPCRALLERLLQHQAGAPP